MAAIVQRATGDQDLSLQLMNSRTDLANYDCYEAAVKHYDTYCYDISQVRINIDTCYEDLRNDIGWTEIMIIEWMYGIY